MREEYKVTITPEQVAELAELVDQNHHTAAMLKLARYVYDTFQDMHEFDKSKQEMYATYEMELYERWKLMQAIEAIHEQYNEIPHRCYELRYEIMWQTMACITNSHDVRGCL